MVWFMVGQDLGVWVKNNEDALYRTFDEIEADISKKYDNMISNAVFNIVPDDWRANVLHDMAARLKVGEQM